MKGWIAAGAAAALGAYSLHKGLSRLPAPFPPSPLRTPDLDSNPIPALPAPVRRFLETVAPDVPTMTSAIITGRLTMRLGSVTVPGRWRFSHEVGRGYQHDMELTVFGRKVAAGVETFIDGHARLDLPTGLIENQPNVNSASTQSMWGEFLWLPSVLATGQWEAIDEQTARLLVPGAAPMVAWFEPETGLLQRFETVRWRDAADPEPLPWVTRNIAWTRFDGIGVPAVAAVQWLDQQEPWLRLSVDDVVWNVPVDLDAV
jgi:hypothetical protein